MKTIHSDQAPQAVGPYSQAVDTGNTLYISGQIPYVAETMAPAGTDIQSQTRQSLENIMAIVNEAGYTKTDIVKCGVFLKDLSLFQEMNAVYADFFGNHKPARFAVEVARLPLDVLIEIDAIAVKNQHN